uniref:Uncharacterized protein n=1 Tax=Glossina pallidipes TaxID=7398 RepID=A0A1A9ZQX0_GLOPL
MGSYNHEKEVNEFNSESVAPRNSFQKEREYSYDAVSYLLATYKVYVELQLQSKIYLYRNLGAKTEHIHNISSCVAHSYQKKATLKRSKFSGVSKFTLQADDLHALLCVPSEQGCCNLIRAGSSGVIQAMVLSFGSFRFSK